MTQAFLAMGSNLEDPVNQINTAIIALAEHPAIQVIKKSRLYQNPPVGLLNQPDFVNAVIEIDTLLSPENLLETVFAVENKQNRVRSLKNGPRTLDLDILLYGQAILDFPNLIIPHPRLKERAFVLLPLAEISPNLILPCGTCLESLLATVKTNHFTILN